jgi:hypothetical protein
MNASFLIARMTFLIAPVVESVTPMKAPAVGGLWITLKGRLFGKIDTNPTVRIGGVPCVKTQWISSTEMRCLSPQSTGTGLPVVAIVAELESQPLNVFEFSCTFAVAPCLPFIIPCV